MSKPLSELLHYSALTHVVRTPLGGVPNNLPPAFLNLTRGKSGNQIAWDILASSRQVAKATMPGSPSVRRKLQKVGQNSATIPRFAEHIVVGGETLTALRGFGTPQQQQKGSEYVDYQVAEAGRRFMNTRIALINSVLKHGKIYLKSDGEGGYDLLPSSSGADITIDMQLSADHTGDLGGLLTDWSASSTNPIDEIQAVMEQALKDTGIPLRHVFYGPNVRKYLLDNDDVKQLLRTDSAMANALKQGAIPDGFGDAQLRWHPMQRSFFNDASGTNQDWFSGDEIVFTPEPSRDWYEYVEGSELLPSGTLGTFGDANAALDATEEIFGRGAYAKLEDDPVQLKQVSVDNGMPVLYVPDAIFTGDCTN